MRHLVGIFVVICAVIGDGWAQNRGSSRYIPAEDFDGDITRAPRVVPTRVAGIRRQRPTKAPEPPAVEDELKPYQPPETPVRTSARRVPQRVNPQHISPPLPVDDAASRYAAPVEESHHSPSAGLDDKIQNTRRRRPKKRRRPQNAVPKIAEDPDKQAIPDHEETELLNDDKKRSERFQSNPTSRNSPPTYDSDPNYQHEKASWESNAPPEQHNSNADSQYFRSQSATNRLPVEDSKPGGHSHGYLESSSGIAGNDAGAPYIPKEPEHSVPIDASYVPVLAPNRGPAQGASRLPPGDYSDIRNKDSSRPTLHSNYNVPLRGNTNRLPVADSEEVIRNTGAKPLHNVIPQSHEPAVPVRGYSNVRLPEDARPLLSPEYAPSSYDSTEDLPSPNAKISEEVKEQPNPSNRLPNPSEIHYDSTYPEYSDDGRGPQRASAARRQEPEESPVRNTRPSSRRVVETKPQEYDNDAEVDGRQVSQYRPPLQRTGSRYKLEDSEGPVRNRAQEIPAPTSAPRTRGSSRHQSTEPEYVPERTRSSTRTRPETSSDDYPNPRSSAAQANTRTRGPPRHVSETVESVPRTGSRRQAINAEEIPRDAPSAGYVPVDEYIRSQQQQTPSHSPRNPATNERVENEPEEQWPVRNTLRSRPQYEIREAEPVDRYEASVEDPNVQNPDYQLPRQTNSRGRTSHRTSLPVEQSPPQPQPEYQLPPNRQQHRQFESPQNPRLRQQPQYQSPQNPRADSRQLSDRQNPSPRPQGRARQQNPEPSPTPRRSSGGGNFVCPETFGFFADPVQCDKYYECRNGTTEMHLCSDGLAFNEISAPKYLRCDSLRDVDCKSRSELQEPQPTKNCPRRHGLFPHETDCTKFWNCVDGVATEVKCPPGLTYNDERATCDWADLVETSCKSEDLLGFTCPEPTTHDLQDGVYTRYPHPDNCQQHFTCIKGADGLRRPRMLSCTDGLVFDPVSSYCKRPEEVPGCEDFYGVRSPAPKRKPARHPEPEPEEIEEEPTPRPRRRGSNRRARN